MSDQERGALERLQFALSLVNFREVSEFGGEELYKEYTEATVPGAPQVLPDGTSGDASSTDEGGCTPLLTEEDRVSGYGQGGRGTTVLSHAQVVERHVENNESMRQDLLTLHGALEFVRTGNPDALPPSLSKDWAKLENEKTGGYAGRNWDQLISASSMVGNGVRTWNDFVAQMQAKMPVHRRTTTTEERLTVRLHQLRERQELTAVGLYSADHTSFAVNPYAFASRKVDGGDFRPGTPEPWPHEVSPADQRVAEICAEADQRALADKLRVLPIGLSFGRPAGMATGSAEAATLTGFQRTSAQTMDLVTSQGLSLDGLNAGPPGEAAAFQET